jgi:hypothetical protein
MRPSLSLSCTSDIINQAVFCYFSFYFFAILLDLHANILRDSARSYIASLLFLLCYFCYLTVSPRSRLQSATSRSIWLEMLGLTERVTSSDNESGGQKFESLRARQ